ncbi:uncharacterized protein LOC100854726 [Vitis vinifera]|uniref:uncharacterized protein LOC100854726 n=1 Tax=Vitis vinifera TaxID=29760 RepID=UPI002882F9A8|nr:uncharacterized protein LOC100854726 [Vitis vinifera]
MHRSILMDLSMATDEKTLLEKLKALYSNLEGLPPDRIIPTVGLNIDRVELSNTKLVFWDLGGQSGLHSIWEKYYEEAHAVVYVIDASCPSCFEDSKSALALCYANIERQQATSPSVIVKGAGMKNKIRPRGRKYGALKVALVNLILFKKLRLRRHILKRQRWISPAP